MAAVRLPSASDLSALASSGSTDAAYVKESLAVIVPALQAAARADKRALFVAMSPDCTEEHDAELPPPAEESQASALIRALKEKGYAVEPARPYPLPDGSVRQLPMQISW